MEQLWWLAGIVGAAYLLDLLVFWRIGCRWCRGTGVWRSPVTRAERDCPRCGGERKIVRWGFLRRH